MMDIGGTRQHMAPGGGQIVLRHIHGASERSRHLGGTELHAHGGNPVISHLQVRPNRVQLRTQHDHGVVKTIVPGKDTKFNSAVDLYCGRRVALAAQGKLLVAPVALVLGAGQLWELK